MFLPSSAEDKVDTRVIKKTKDASDLQSLQPCLLVMLKTVIG